ncbi:MAG TPA: kelch repeat-containing protein [Gemmatimonadales bacterium]
MRRSLLPSAVLLGSFAVAACGDDPVQPNAAAGPTAAVPALAVASNSWLRRADLWSIERWDHAAATVTDAAGHSIVYVIGGRSAAGGSLTKVMAYDVSTNKWTLKAPLPVPRFSTNGAAVIDGKIFVSGGRQSSKNWAYTYPSNQSYMYDPRTDTWTRKQNMPDGGEIGFTALIGGKLYVLSRCIEAPPMEYWFDDCDPPRANFFRYNRVKDQWTTLPSPANTYTTGGAAGVIGGKFYVAGGTNLEVYDPATNRWAARRPPPRFLGFSPTGTTANGKLYVFGGRGLRNQQTGVVDTLRTTSIYDPATDSWTTGRPLPTPRSNAAATRIFVNGQVGIQVVGGSRPGNNLQYFP